MENFEKLLSNALNKDDNSLEKLKSSAGAGVAEAQYYLALYYEKINGNNNSDYQYWIKKAISNGYKSAESIIKRGEEVKPIKADDIIEDIEVSAFGYMAFSFTGRIGRKEYIISIMIFILFCFVVFQVPEPKLQLLLRLLLDWFILSQAARRFHDFGESGWWVLIPIVSWIWAIFPKSVDEKIVNSDEISEMTEEETKDRINCINFDSSQWDGSADSLPSQKSK